MWCILLAVATATPSIEGLQQTALDLDADSTDRSRAVVALSELAQTDDDARWAVLELRHQLDPESDITRVATAAAIQVATLDDLAGAGWPAWARGHVAARVDTLLPPRCSEPDVWALPVQPARLADTCGPRLDVGELADQLLAGEDSATQRRAADVLVELELSRRAEVHQALAERVAWRPEIELPLTGSAPVLHRLDWAVDERLALATELVTWRVALTLVGVPDVPERLDAELRELMWAELDRYGEPEQTQGWLHVLGSAGVDPAPVLIELGLQSDARWQRVVEQDQTLKGSVTDAIGLLGASSTVVRARAAARLEANPALTGAALRKMYRFSSGRSAPLRGDITAPALDYTGATADKWASVLVDWVERSIEERDDAALRATLILLTEPSLTAALPQRARDDLGQRLLQLADGDGARSGDLVQAMDALARGVAFGEGGVDIEDGEVMREQEGDWYAVPMIESPPEQLPVATAED